jgi:methylmalonyl-CoA/ethylmalonyl-CoA epimerase
MTIKVKGIDHVAIQVHDLDKACDRFSEVFDVKFGDLITQESPVWELVEKFDEPLRMLDVCAPRVPGQGPMAKALEKRGEGLCELSLKVEDLEEADRHMKAHGVREITRIEREGKPVSIYYHPKDLCGVMVMLTKGISG